ncbi:MAG: hypothetical protein Ct9H300mP1_03570 [Planctomycetaceae bacterium]|nr:MAG: hypothetical protein Ct9H300mP1_03570 [Planctomycetaceae bacterium]
MGVYAGGPGVFRLLAVEKSLNDTFPNKKKFWAERKGRPTILAAAVSRPTPFSRSSAGSVTASHSRSAVGGLTRG